MIFTRNPPCIWIHVYRTAGTSISSWLPQAKEFQIEFARLPHCSASHTEVLVGESAFRSAWKWAIVRHPWDWLASQFELLNGHPNHWFSSKMREMAFHEFAFSYPTIYSEHYGYRTQSDFIRMPDGGMGVDFLLPYERISELWPWLCYRVGISEDRAKVELPRLNISRKRQEWQSCFSVFSQDEMAALEKLYERDWDLYRKALQSTENMTGNIFPPFRKSVLTDTAVVAPLEPHMRRSIGYFIRGQS